MPLPLPILPTSDPPLRVMALHALLYCERLFYLEEVEEIRVADAAVYAGRELHESLAAADEGAIGKRWIWPARPWASLARSIASNARRRPCPV